MNSSKSRLCGFFGFTIANKLIRVDFLISMFVFSSISWTSGMSRVSKGKDRLLTRVVNVELVEDVLNLLILFVLIFCLLIRHQTVLLVPSSQPFYCL